MKVTTYKGHKVPEGATHFGKKTERFRDDLFYKDAGTHVFVNGLWRHTFTNRVDLIELPEQEESVINWNEAPIDTAAWDAPRNGVNAGWIGDWYSVYRQPEQEITEWKPSAGEECEYSQSSPNAKRVNWYKDTFIHKHGEHVWLGDSGLIHSKNLKFRPLRTEAEKKRDAFIDGIMRGVSIDVKYFDVVHNIADQLFKAGYISPKGEG